MAKPKPSGGEMLEELIPRHEFAEFHAREIAAPPEVVWRALEEVTLGEMPISRRLFAIRSLPSRLGKGAALPSDPDLPLLAQMLSSGFVELGKDPPRERLAGIAAEVGRSFGELIELAGPADFAGLDRPGCMKAAMNFMLEPCDDGATHLSTETRVLTTSRGARRTFRLYWAVVRPWSGAIRREWLRAVARRAERDGHPATLAPH